MKKVFFYLILIGFLNFLKAQEILNVNLSSKKWIEKAIYELKNQKNAHLSFIYQNKNLPPFQKGELLLSKDKYHFSIENLTQICDGQHLRSSSTLMMTAH